LTERRWRHCNVTKTFIRNPYLRQTSHHVTEMTTDTTAGDLPYPVSYHLNSRHHNNPLRSTAVQSQPSSNKLSDISERGDQERLKNVGKVAPLTKHQAMKASPALNTTP